MRSEDLRRDVRFTTANANPASGWMGRLVPIAVGAVVALAAFGAVTWFLGQRPAPGPAPQIVVAEGLTEFEIKACESTAAKAAEKGRNTIAESGPLPPIHLPSRTAAVVNAGTLITCEAKIRPARMCAPTEKAAFTAAVRDYFALSDSMHAHINSAMTELTQGPKAVIIDVFIKGIGFSTGFVAISDDHVARAVTAMAAAGYVREADYAALFGMGIPPTVTKALATVPASPSACG